MKCAVRGEWDYVWKETNKMFISSNGGISIYIPPLQQALNPGITLSDALGELFESDKQALSIR